MSDAITPNADATASGQDLGAQLDQLNSTLQGGLTNIDPAAAVGVVDRFRAALSGASDPALAGIATELESFRSVLAGNHSGVAIGEALTTLGAKVTALADAGGPAADKLSQLGRNLSGAASQLGRAD